MEGWKWDCGKIFYGFVKMFAKVIETFYICGESKKLIMEFRDMMDFDTPHVVFRNAMGKIVFSQASFNLHEGLEVLGWCRDFHTAHEFCEELKYREYEERLVDGRFSV